MNRLCSDHQMALPEGFEPSYQTEPFAVGTVATADHLEGKLYATQLSVGMQQPSQVNPQGFWVFL